MELAQPVLCELIVLLRRLGEPADGGEYIFWDIHAVQIQLAESIRGEIIFLLR